MWQAVKVSFGGSTFLSLRKIKYLFWGINLFTILGMWLYNFTPPEWLGKNMRTVIMVGVFMNYFSKLFVVLFLLIDDLGRFIRWIISKINPKTVTESTEIAPKISRSEFLMKTALVVGTVPPLAMTWGIISGAHDYRVRKIKLAIRNLPKAFNGLTIAQISDIHSGSFFNKTAVKGGVEMLMGLKPDMVFFTGDMVNNKAKEVREYTDIFNKIKAPLGVFSTLGNHDYGDYVKWESSSHKAKNLQDLVTVHRQMGYDILNDENRILKIGDEKLAIVGVQNISGQDCFRTYGNLGKAMAGTQEAATKLLLSHDPTHWDKEINSRFLDVDATFSGHTHGTQFGINIGEKTYSPAQWAYKQWGGLYTQGHQHLYVNRGYGYIGYPGRIGMPPEITLFELTPA